MTTHPHCEPRVLIVDDQEDLRQLIVDTVATYGYKTMQAGNGSEALCILRRREHGPYILLTDFSMPKLNGADLVRAVHDENLLVSGIILMSGTFSPESKPALSNLLNQYPRQIPFYFLRKPFELKVLENIIRQLKLA